MRHPFTVNARTLASSLILISAASFVLASEEGGGMLPAQCFTLIPYDCHSAHADTGRTCGTNNNVRCADVPLDDEQTYYDVTGTGTGAGKIAYEQDLAGQVNVYFHKYRCGDPQLGESPEQCIFEGKVNRQCTGRKLKGRDCEAGIH